jgi:hypothetical protein
MTYEMRLDKSVKRLLAETRSLVHAGDGVKGKARGRFS